MTQVRPRSVGPIVLAAAGAVVVLVVLVAQLRDLGWDLDAYVEAGRRLAGGEPLYQAVTQQGTFQPGPPGLYLYPPPLAVAMAPFVELPHAVQTLLWGAVHVLALVVACLAMPTRASVRFGALIAGALMYPVIDDIRLGNVSVLVLCLAALSWRWLGRPASSVALAVSMAIRPTQGVVLVAGLLRRAWRPAIWTCLAGLGLVVVTLPVVGLDGWFDYLTMLRNLGSGMGVPFDFSIGSVGLRAGLSSDLASLLQLGGYVLGAVAILVSLRRDPDTTFHVAIGASLLLAPLLWVHYLSLALLPAAFLAHRGRVLPLVLLAPVSWLPTILGQGESIYPLLAIAATLAPLLTPGGRSVIAGGDAESIAPGGSRNAPVQEWDPEQVP